MDINTCIFCGGPAEADHREHILPDSLGGDICGTLPAGLVCKSCNHYFGSRVEQPALNSFPFLMWRLIMGIPTKKRKQPWAKAVQGRISGVGVGGRLAVDAANPHMAEGIRNGAISEMRMIAEVTEPKAVCRLLLKIGLEIVAFHDPQAVRSARYDVARRVARRPACGDNWAFLLTSDSEQLMAHLKSCPTFLDTLALVDSGVYDFEGGDVLGLSLPGGFELICPLEPHYVDESLRQLPPPKYQLYEVVFGRTAGN